MNQSVYLLGTSQKRMPVGFSVRLWCWDVCNSEAEKAAGPVRRDIDCGNALSASRPWKIAPLEASLSHIASFRCPSGSGSVIKYLI